MKLDELLYYLSSLKSIASSMDLHQPLYKDETTTGQIAYHAAQAANYWIRVVILEQKYSRNRDDEFSKQPTQELILQSIESALDGVRQLKASNIDLNKTLPEKNIEPGNFKVNSVFTALTHTVAHTAEHVGELNQLKQL